MVQPQLIANGDFEKSKKDRNTDADPWVSTAPYGFDAYWGTNYINRNGNPAFSPVSGDAFLWFESTNGIPPTEISQPLKGFEAGQQYNLSYFGYSWRLNPADTSSIANWTIQIGDNLWTDVSPESYEGDSVATGNGLAAADWPHYTHNFNATGTEDSIVITNLNNSVMYMDVIELTCITCPPVKPADHTGTIVGAVIGGLAGLAILVVGSFWLWLWILKPRRRERQNAKALEAEKEKGGFPDLHTFGSPAPPYVPQQPEAFHHLPEVQEVDLHRPDQYPVFRPHTNNPGGGTGGQ